MLYSKSNLKVGQVASKVPFDDGLHGVKLEEDGSTVAGNGKVLMAVGPANPSRVRFPDKAAEQTDPPTGGVVMPLDAVEKALKHMTSSKNISLQHVALTRMRDASRLGFTSIDAKGNPTTNADMPKRDRYPDWKSTVKKVRGSGQGVKVCLNSKDLIHLLKAIEEACPDRGGTNPVFLEISEDGIGLIARGMNQETGQHAIGIIKAFKLKEGQWLMRDDWERKVFDTPVKRKKKKKPPKKKKED